MCAVFFYHFIIMDLESVNKHLLYHHLIKFIDNYINILAKIISDLKILILIRLDDIGINVYIIDCFISHLD